MCRGSQLDNPQRIRFPPSERTLPSYKVKFESSTDKRPRRSPPVYYRGRGRPTKAELASKSCITGDSAVTLHRQRHNDSAMRSRHRFTARLQVLWDIIPEPDKFPDGSNNGRNICQADKVEIAIEYILKLQSHLAHKKREEEVRYQDNGSKIRFTELL